MTASTLTAAGESASSGHNHAVQFYESESFLRDPSAASSLMGLSAENRSS